MPEIYIACGEKRYFVNHITVGQYRKYAELMKKNDGDCLSDALFFNQKIAQEIFDSRMSLEELGETDIVEVMVAAKSIHFVMQQVITPKFLELMDEPVEQETSAFDDYDRENGYDEEDTQGNIWQVCSDNIDRVIQIAIKLLNNSYSQCLETDIVALLDYMKFAIKTINEKQ